MSTPGRESYPVWSHDGQRVAYAAERDGSTQIYRIKVTVRGRSSSLTDGANPKVPRDWSRDGRYLIYSEVHPQNQSDLWILPLDSVSGRPGKPIEFLTTPASETSARFSPDGKWIAYTSNTAGRSEAFVRAFPGGPPGEWPVSSGGALDLVWRPNGSELFYRYAESRRRRRRSRRCGGDSVSAGSRGGGRSSDTVQKPLWLDLQHLGRWPAFSPIWLCRRDDGRRRQDPPYGGSELAVGAEVVPSTPCIL